MPVSDQLLSYPARAYETLVRGRDQTLVCPAYRRGAIVAATAATLTLYSMTSAAVLDAVDAAPVDGVPTYALAAATTAALELGEGYLLAWVITYADGVREHRVEAALVRSELRPPATEADLYARVSALDPSSPAAISRSTDYANKLDTAWYEIEAKLRASGRRPYLVLTSSALFLPHVYLTLALIFEDLGSRLKDGYTNQARYYRSQFAASWGELQLTEDADLDGLPRPGEQGQPLSGAVFLGSSRAYRRGRETW